MTRFGCKAVANIVELSASHTNNSLVNELFNKTTSNQVIHNGLYILGNVLKTDVITSQTKAMYHSSEISLLNLFRLQCLVSVSESASADDFRKSTGIRSISKVVSVHL